MGGHIMRKMLISISALFALLIVFAVFACEKAIISDENESGATKGNLRVSVYQIEKTPFASLFPGSSQASTRGAKTASEACTRLNFAIYNQVWYACEAG